MTGAPHPGRPSRAYREGAPIFKYKAPQPEAPRNPGEVRPGEVCIQESTLRELILSAREALRLVGDLTGAAGVRRLDIPEVKRLAAACGFAEKNARKRANEMKAKTE